MIKKSIAFLFVVAFCMSGCKKQVATNCLQVKIIRTTCASMVLQVQNNNSIGQDNWVDIFQKENVYDNVFTVSNACHVPSEYKVGDVLYVTIAPAAPGDCVQCAMYDAPPKVSYEVKTFGNLPCGETPTK